LIRVTILDIRLNRNFKKIFGDNVHLEHIVPKKYFLDYWKTCDDIDIFEKLLRDESSICFLYKNENSRLPSYIGRDSLAKAFEIYKRNDIDIEPFAFNKEIEIKTFDIPKMVKETDEKVLGENIVNINILDWNGIQEKINRIIKDVGVRANLEKFIKKIINNIDNTCSIRPAVKDDISLYKNGVRILQINCRTIFYHIVLKDSYSVPKSIESIYNERYKARCFNQIEKLSDEQMDEFIRYIERF